MASGLALVTSGVGGAGELVDDGRTGLRFIAGNSEDLARCLIRLVRDVALLDKLRQSGQNEARQRFSVMASAATQEAGFKKGNLATQGKAIF